MRNLTPYVDKTLKILSYHYPYQHFPFNTMYAGYIFHTPVGEIKVSFTELNKELNENVIQYVTAFPNPDNPNFWYMMPNELVDFIFQEQVQSIMFNLIDRKIRQNENKKIKT